MLFIPSQSLAYIYYGNHLIQGSKQIKTKTWAWQQGINHQIYPKQLDMKSSIKQTYSSCSSTKMHVHVNA